MIVGIAICHKNQEEMAEQADGLMLELDVLMKLSVTKAIKFLRVHVLPQMDVFKEMDAGLQTQIILYGFQDLHTEFQ